MLRKWSHKSEQKQSFGFVLVSLKTLVNRAPSCRYKHTLTTDSDVAVLPRSSGVHGVAPGSQTIVWVTTIVVPQVFISIPVGRDWKRGGKKEAGWEVNHNNWRGLPLLSISVIYSSICHGCVLVSVRKINVVVFSLLFGLERVYVRPFWVPPLALPSAFRLVDFAPIILSITIHTNFCQQRNNNYQNIVSTVSGI